MVRWFRPILNVLLALALALAPLLPAAAMAPAVGIEAAAADHQAPQPPHHGSDAQASDVADHTGCEQHQGCDGQCCAACAHCFTAAFSAAQGIAHARPVQSATHEALHPSPYISLLNRPPQAA